MSVFIVAEIGVNHGGDLGMAAELISAAAEAGADAVKFQAYHYDEICTPTAPQYEMLREMELSEPSLWDLYDACGTFIEFVASSFDIVSTTILHKIGVKRFKVPSGEIISLDYLRHMARFGKPIILSTGMCTLGEVEQAVNAIESQGNHQITLLHCVSAYPAEPADYDLRVLDTLHTAFGYPVGLSDHTLTSEVAIAAVALGATVIEKHLTLDRNLPGPDHAASATPAEFKELVRAIRVVESALGDGRKRVTEAERATAKIARRGPSGKRE